MAGPPSAIRLHHRGTGWRCLSHPPRRSRDGRGVERISPLSPFTRMRWISRASVLAFVAFLIFEWSLYGLRAGKPPEIRRRWRRHRCLRRRPIRRPAVPVFKARLDHAFDLEEEGLAPLVITTGAGGASTVHRSRRGARLPYPARDGGGNRPTNPARSLSECRGRGASVAQRHARSCIAVSDGFTSTASSSCSRPAVQDLHLSRARQSDRVRSLEPHAPFAARDAQRHRLDLGYRG